MAVEYELYDRAGLRAVDMEKGEWVFDADGTEGSGAEAIRSAAWSSWERSLAREAAGKGRNEHRSRPAPEVVDALAEWWGDAPVEVHHDHYTDWQEDDDIADRVDWFRMWGAEVVTTDEWDARFRATYPRPLPVSANTNPEGGE
jgi:hypothetical protein